MSNVALSPPVPSRASFASSSHWIAAVLAAWFALVLFLGAREAFTTPPGTPPLPIVAAVMVPIVLFLAALRLSRSVHEYVESIDLRLITGVQAWRAAGFGFLALYVHGVLPGFFVWPAGLGDIAIGLTAPYVALAFTRRPEYAARRTFAVWNVLGILDLVVAVGIGGLSYALASGAAGEITTGPMAELPLVLIPVFFVPLFVILHIVALLQARRARGRSGAAVEAEL